MATPLSVGATRGQKIFISVFALVFVAILSGAIFILTTFILPGFLGTETESDFGPPSWLVYAIGGFFALVFLTIVIVFVTVIVATFRHKASLDGSRLQVTGAYRTRSVDLATARAWIGTQPAPGGDEPLAARRRIPLLYAQDQGRRVRLRLHDNTGSLLPPDELLALAAAMPEGPTADQLRHLATDPTARLL
ncbi:hypothetical protein ACIBG8_40550 [Nonomuraea sp. NPDC050556]|uniref:hypothetical protein n=1 Tax=Nonomuraea sp. NPDC050556 TaxID=3364369 RepID=UPI0037AF8DF5